MKRIPCLAAIFSLSLSASAWADSMDASPAAAASDSSEAQHAASSSANDSPAESASTDTTMPAQHDDLQNADPSVAADSAPAASDEQAGFSRGSVVRSIFTTAISEREPVDKLANKANDTDQIFYFTELRDMSGQTATHRWEHDGKVVAEVKFNVRGPRWRVWSSKSFVPGWDGDWKVSVLNGAGETISEDLITLSGIPTENAMPETTSDSMPATQSEAAPASETAPVTEEFSPPVEDKLLQ